MISDYILLSISGIGVLYVGYQLYSLYNLKEEFNNKIREIERR
jgi:hypothetical protein